LSTGYKIDCEGLYFLTFQIVGWVDLFTRQIYRDIVIDSLKYCQINKGLQLYAYVIMSNHMHLLADSEKGDLSGLIRDFKNYTSHKILENIEEPTESRREWIQMVFEYNAKFKNKQDNQVWTHGNHPEYIFSQKFIEQKINYIHNNPVRAGIVRCPEDYIYSSASNYADLESIIRVIKLDFKWKTVR
jgi:REP element-mobilizing transposase RayT